MDICQLNSCICFLLYNKDKERVIIRGKSDTATWYSVLARQQNLKRFPALVFRVHAMASHVTPHLPFFSFVHTSFTCGILLLDQIHQMCQIRPNTLNNVFCAHIWASQIWSRRVSPKRSYKMQFRRINPSPKL